jgi:hypothetical protein
LVYKYFKEIVNKKEASMNSNSFSPSRRNNIPQWMILLLLLVFTPTACNLPFFSTQDDTNAEANTAVARTVMAQLTQQIPGVDPSLLLTGIPLLVPLVHVDVETNCRTGPDKQYDRLGVLLVGEQAEVVGKNTVANYWVINNPDAPGTCWLWGMYATVEGNTDHLAEMTPPPTPTPPPTATPYLDFTATFLGICDLSGSPWANFLISNTGTLTLESQRLTVVDTTANSMMYGPGDSNKPFRSTMYCADTTLVESIAVGTTGYSRCHVSSAVSGHNARATIKLCSQNGYVGSCVEKVVNFIIP